MEKIAYLDLNEKLTIFLSQNEMMPLYKLTDFINENADCCIRFDDRDKLENDTSKLQLVSVAAIIETGYPRIFALRKGQHDTSRESAEKDKLLLYCGGHVNSSDLIGYPTSIKEILFEGMKREVAEEIGAYMPDGDYPAYIIYSQDEKKKNRHLACCFIINLNVKMAHDAFLKVHLSNTEHEYNTNIFHVLDSIDGVGRFYTIQEILNMCIDEFDSWSTKIFDEVCRQNRYTTASVGPQFTDTGIICG